MTTETQETLLGRDVILEDGLVVMPAGKNRRVIWVQCPTCGPQPPATGWNERRECNAILFHVEDSCLEQGLLLCSVCGQDAPFKEMLIPRERKRRHEKCTGRCLRGQTFCACGCNGRCHGEGKCYCKEEADDARA